MMATIDSELVKKTRKAVEKLSENLYIIGNEPTLACYRIQEHVHKSGPMIIDKGTEMKKVRRNLQGCCYGVEYSINSIKQMEGSTVHFQNIQELLKNALFIKQQLDYEENVRARVRAKQQQQQKAVLRPERAASSNASNPSVKRTAFQRFSGSFDIPATIFTSSISSMSTSASSDFKELHSALSRQFKQPTSSMESSNEAGPSNAAVTSTPQVEDNKRMF